eukprot:12406878-Karenia_brevis.AAC.1
MARLLPTRPCGMKPGPRSMERSRNGNKGAGGNATRLRARIAGLRATRPCGMKPGPCGMEPRRNGEKGAGGTATRLRA